jgi:NADH dehydrogenase
VKKASMLQELSCEVHEAPENVRPEGFLSIARHGKVVLKLPFNRKAKNGNSQLLATAFVMAAVAIAGRAGYAQMARTRVVIVGGGFAGVKCAKSLRTTLSGNRGEIVLFNHENHMVFHPLLAEVAGASINPEAVAAPLRQMLPGVHCRTEDVQQIDLEHSHVVYESHDGQLRHMPYDHVVLACGAAVNLGTVPGMADHAFPLKTIGDAIALRSHVMQQLEKAEVCDDPALKRWYLSFIVVGGGFSGVEVAGEINDLVRGSERFFQNITCDDITVTIIHSREQLLPELTPGLRDFARTKMEQAGIVLCLKARVAYVTPEGVGLQDGRLLRGATVVCTIGNTTPSVIERLDVRKEGDRLLTRADMRLTDFDNAWAIGDCAHIVNAYNHGPSPATGQFAERQGRQAAENIVRVVHGKPTRPFAFRPLGQLCSIGGHNAVADVFGLRLSGFLAWFLWRGIYLFKLPSWSRRVKVGFDWAWDLLFARDLAHPRAQPTERVSRAYYQPGDYIFRQGEPAMNFYVIERGEVEVLQTTNTTEPAALLNILGPGDFFGEMALIADHPRSASIRARTAVEVLVMGRHVFTHISSALAPFRSLLTEVMQKRRASLWQHLPMAQDTLSQYPLSTFIEPFAASLLKPESTFAEAITWFDTHNLDFCCVLDDRHCLRGILTRTDIFRAIEMGAQHHTPVHDFMAKEPVAMTTEDSSLLAAATMRDHGFTRIPVIDRQDRRLQGYVRAERMLSVIVQSQPVDALP